MLYNIFFIFFGKETRVEFSTEAMKINVYNVSKQTETYDIGLDHTTCIAKG